MMKFRKVFSLKIIFTAVIIMPLFMGNAYASPCTEATLRVPIEEQGSMSGKILKLTMHLIRSEKPLEKSSDQEIIEELQMYLDLFSGEKSQIRKELYLERKSFLGALKKGHFGLKVERRHLIMATKLMRKLFSRGQYKSLVFLLYNFEEVVKPYAAKIYNLENTRTSPYIFLKEGLSCEMKETELNEIIVKHKGRFKSSEGGIMLKLRNIEHDSEKLRLFFDLEKLPFLRVQEIGTRKIMGVFSEGEIDINALTLDCKVRLIEEGILKISPEDYPFLDAEWRMIYNAAKNKLSIEDLIEAENNLNGHLNDKL